jgi:hypothetical protein
MDYQFIDYCDVYYSVMAGPPRPPRRRGKFVQIIDESAGCTYLILSPAELSVYHADIVERFFALSHRTAVTRVSRDRVTLGGAGWRVAGGGTWVVDDADRSARFAGESAVYGPCHPTDVRQALQATAALAGYHVAIG